MILHFMPTSASCCCFVRVNIVSSLAFALREFECVTVVSLGTRPEQTVAILPCYPSVRPVIPRLCNPFDDWKQVKGVDCQRISPTPPPADSAEQRRGATGPDVSKKAQDPTKSVAGG